MQTLLRTLGIIATTVILTIVTLAAIGFARGSSRTRAARAAAPIPAITTTATPVTAPAPASSSSTSTTDAPVTTPSSPSATATHATTPPAPSAQPASTTPPTSTPAPSAPASTSALIRQLTDLESQGKHTDAALIAFDKSKSPAEADTLIPWLNDRISSGRIPALYLLARVHFHNNNLPQAARYYSAASLSARIDAARLTDKTAAGAVPGMEAHFSEIKRALAADTTLRREAFTWALDFETTIKDRAPATWIAAHGLSAFDGGPAKTIPDADWQTKRQSLRDTWTKLAAE